MQFVNLTPHAITLRTPEGVDIVVAPSGQQARVQNPPAAQVGIVAGVPVYAAQQGGTVSGIPDPALGTIYIVSGMVLASVVGRPDVMAPGTGPADGAIRENGQIVAVTRLICAG